MRCSLVGAAFAVDLSPFADDVVSKVDIAIEQLGGHGPSILTILGGSRCCIVVLCILVTLVSQKTVVPRSCLAPDFFLNQQGNLGMIIRVVEAAHRVAFLLSVADDPMQRADQFTSCEE